MLVAFGNLPSICTQNQHKISKMMIFKDGLSENAAELLNGTKMASRHPIASLSDTKHHVADTSGKGTGHRVPCSEGDD